MIENDGNDRERILILLVCMYSNREFFEMDQVEYINCISMINMNIIKFYVL